MGIKRAAAYAAIYVLWGGSYLAIRLVVAAIPPFLAAGIRYSLGGLILLALSAGLRREPLPRWKPAMYAMLAGTALLTLSYGVVYWAETRLDSWIVAVLVSTILLWTYVGEWMVYRVRKLSTMTLLPVLAGLAGMPLLLRATLRHGHGGSLSAAIAVIAGSGLWAAMTLLLKKVELPRSAVQTAALQLCSAGATLFCVAYFSGEFAALPAIHLMLAEKPLWGMVYLVLASSVVGFTAFNWLLAHESASLVATASYVNPVVAMFLGIFAVHEVWSPAQLLGAAVILSSVVVIWCLQRRVEPESDVEHEECVRVERAAA
ncbi:MAG TPA: EamA family transporter [Acidobacteriaceae bacterium]|jgi:drug/metabolite transporter (DMT)-like permease